MLLAIIRTNVIIMSRQVALDKGTYERLVVLSGELTAMTRKSITFGMTVSCAISLLETMLKTPVVNDFFKESIRSSTLESSEEFVSIWKWVATKALREESP